MEYYSAIKRDKIGSLGVMCMNLESVMQSVCLFLSHPFTFNLFVSLHLKCVSSTHQMVRSIIHSVNLCVIRSMNYFWCLASDSFPATPIFLIFCLISGQFGEKTWMFPSFTLVESSSHTRTHVKKFPPLTTIPQASHHSLLSQAIFGPAWSLSCSSQNSSLYEKSSYVHSCYICSIIDLDFWSNVE